MPTPEETLNNKNEQKENLLQNPENQEVNESVEDMQNRLSQEITTSNEKLKQEDKKIETANDSIGLPKEEVEEVKTSMNLDSQISSINTDAEKLTTESKNEINTKPENQAVENSNTSLIEKTKQEKFNSLKMKFEKNYENSKPTEYNLKEISDNLGKAFFGGKLPEIDNILNSLPKDVIENLKTGESTSYDSKNSFNAWQKAIGNRINQLNNNRTEYYDLKTGTKLGMIPKEAKSYLMTVANAARFFPKEVSETHIKEAIDIFTDEQKLSYATGGKDFIGTANGRLKNIPEELNVLRNLCEANYKDEAKKLLVVSLKKHGRDEGYGNSSKAFELTRMGLFSEDEVKDILDQAGLLEEPKETKNESWG